MYVSSSYLLVLFTYRPSFLISIPIILEYIKGYSQYFSFRFSSYLSVFFLHSVYLSIPIILQIKYIRLFSKLFIQAFFVIFLSISTNRSRIRPCCSFFESSEKGTGCNTAGGSNNIYMYTYIIYISYTYIYIK